MKRKIERPSKISAMCKYCTPTYMSKGHYACYNLNCNCWHHCVKTTERKKELHNNERKAESTSH